MFLQTKTQRIEKILIRLFAADEVDIIREALCVVQQLYPNCELTLYDVSEKKIVGTSLLNEDEKSSLSLLLSNTTVFSSHGSEFSTNRWGVIRTEVVVISKTENSSIALVIEHKDNKKIPDNKLNTVHALLGAIVKMQLLERVSKTALHLDSLTGLKSRDLLVSEFEGLPKENYNICVVSLANAEHINRTKGMCVTDRILCDIAIVLSKSFGEYVYRIGGTKFLVTMQGSLYDVNAYAQEVVDRITALNKNTVLSAVLTPLQDDLYHSIYLCEKMLRSTNENEVTVIREHSPEAMRNSSYDVERTFLPNYIQNYDSRDDDDVVGVEIVHFENQDEEQVSESLEQETAPSEFIFDTSFEEGNI